jgi:hypothetical protein
MSPTAIGLESVYSYTTTVTPLSPRAASSFSSTTSPWMPRIMPAPLPRAAGERTDASPQLALVPLPWVPAPLPPAASAISSRRWRQWGGPHVHRIRGHGHRERVGELHSAAFSSYETSWLTEASAYGRRRGSPASAGWPTRESPGAVDALSHLIRRGRNSYRRSPPYGSPTSYR